MKPASGDSEWQKLTAWAIGGRRAGGARGGRRIGVSSVEPVVRLDVHRPQEQLAEHRHPRVVVERDHRVSRQEEDDHLPETRGRLDKNTSFFSIAVVHKHAHTIEIILPTEKFGHLYIVVCVMVGVPPPRVASRALKKLRSGLRPTSSGRILSAFW
jgi:hypothetical protein